MRFRETDLMTIRRDMERCPVANFPSPATDFVTAVALQCFPGAKLDCAVTETGFGGLPDATETVARNCRIALLNAVDLDRTAVLGETSPRIAVREAGTAAAGEGTVTS
ncbi:hypothetical protein ACWD25_27770 [Streptomyces sp. NPDC002920]